MYDGERKNVNPLVYLFTKETFILLVALQIIYKLTNLTSAFFLDHLDPAFTTIKTNFVTKKKQWRKVTDLAMSASNEVTVGLSRW